MKLLVWGLMLTFNFTAIHANPSEASHYAQGEPKLSGKPTSGELEDLQKIAKYDNSQKMRLLARKICTIYTLSGVNIARDTKNAIKKYMSREEGIKNPTGAQMLRFLNKNRHKMTCKDNGVEKNYMMYAFDRGAHGNLFDGFFIDELIPEDLSVLVDVNAVSCTEVNEKPETVLDYMDKLIANKRNTKGFIEEVKSLKELFVEDLGAKNFRDLPSSEQAKHNRLTCPDK